MWLCGYVALWLYGYVAKFQIFIFQTLKFPKLQSQISNFPNYNFQAYKFTISQITNSELSFWKFKCPSFKQMYIDFPTFSKNIFSYLQQSYFALKSFGIFKSINKGSPGLNNPEIMDMLGFGPSHNKIWIF